MAKTLITHCTACGKELEPEFPGINPESEQYDNALEVKFDGGYGMFIDPIDKEYRAIICHECAHELCERVPWIGMLIDPYCSHSHKQGHNWTKHWGWDLPH